MKFYHSVESQILINTPVSNLYSQRECFEAAYEFLQEFNDIRITSLYLFGVNLSDLFAKLLCLPPDHEMATYKDWYWQMGMKYQKRGMYLLNNA